MSKSVVGSMGRLAWRLLEFYRLDPAAVFGRQGISQDDLSNPNFRMSYRAFDAVWQAAQSLIADPCAGLNAVHLWHPSTFGALGYAMLASSSLRSMLDRVIRYQQVVAEESMIQVTEVDKGILVEQLGHHHQTGDLPLFVDVGFASWMSLIRFNYGHRLDPVEVNLMRSAPVCADRYRDFFHCPVHFDAPRNNLILPKSAMDEALPNSNRQIAQLHDQVLHAYLEQQKDDELVSRIKEAIIGQLASGEVSKETVAEALHMSPSTLLRRLKDRETTFADILNGTRRELAIGYIKDNRLPLIEISFLLGFANTSAFTRAFKRWSGKTPAEARRI